MNCKKEWNRKILVNKFSKKFVDKDYKQHREQCLLESERALLPATQPLVEEIRRKKIIKDEMRKIKDEIRNLTRRYIVLEGELRNDNNNNVEKESRVFIRHCPNGECNGFLSNQWKCGLCEMWACSNCHEVKGKTRDVEHVCRQENIETAKLIEKETRPCPSCASPIFKIDGCNQIWCTQCHTAFSWTTGKIETTVHNPHYYEWLRRSGRENERNPLELQCGREIDNNFVRKLSRMNGDNNALDTCRGLIHMRLVEVPRYTGDRLRNNENLRVRFMMKEITEDKFKSLLQKRDKDMNKKHEVSNVLGMYLISATDIMYRYIDELKNGKCEFKTYDAELLGLRKYANQCLKDISDVYNCKTITF
jgi:hypothetical protein